METMFRPDQRAHGQQDVPEDSLPRSPLCLLMAVYVGTALLQPVGADTIRYLGGAGHIGWPPTLLNQLCNTLAMASLVPLAFSKRRCLSTLLVCPCIGVAEEHEGRGAPHIIGQGPRLDATALRYILIATAIDFLSGALLTTGLLMLGGGVFVVVYSSTAMWTAVWTRCSGKRLAAGRWAGVLLVSGGMVLNARENFVEAVDGTLSEVTFGCAALVLGTALHAALFVYAEVAIVHARIDLFVLCATMGAIESALLILWNLALLGVYGASIFAPEQAVVHGTLGQVALLYAALAFVNAVHAWSFFSMLQRIGAVSSAVMKGIQLSFVFVLSTVLFCQWQQTQCFSWGKAEGVMVVVMGLFVYAHFSGVHNPGRLH